jgi:hypothetical protein
MSGRSRRHAQPKLHASEAQPLTRRIAGLVPVAVPAVVIVLAGLWFGGFFSGGSDSGPLPTASQRPVSDGALPSFVTASGERVIAAYEYALAAADKLVYIPCYCGCGEHSGHKSVRDCFIKSLSASGVTYDEHGAGCDMCVSIVLDVQRLLAEGKSLAEARAYVDQTYAGIGSPTDTPLPPEGW